MPTPDLNLESFDDDDELAGLPPRRTPSTAPASAPATPAVVAAPAPTERAATAAPARSETSTPSRSKSRSRSSRPSAKATGSRPSTAAPLPGSIRSTSIHLKHSVYQRLKAEREKTGTSNANLMKLALEATREDLPQLLRSRRSATGTLFQSIETQTVASSDEATLPVNARFYEADFAILDQLMEEVGARHWSPMINAALDKFLPQL